METLEARTMMAATPLYWDPAGAATATGGAGTWDTTAAQWRSGSATGSLVAWSNVGDANGPYQAVFPGSAGTVTIGVGVTASSVSFTASGYTLSGGNVLTLAGGTGQVDVASGGTATISAPMAGTVGITKASAGLLALTGTNTYSGGTRIAAGTLRVASDASLGEVPASTATNVTFSGTGSLQAGAASVSLAAQRGVSIAAGVTATLDTQANTLTVNGPVSNAATTGVLAKGGTAGMLVLAGSNSFVAGTTVNMGGSTNVGAGTLELANSGALGTNAITVDAHNVTNYAAATLLLAGGVTVGSNVTYLVGGHQPGYNVDLDSVGGSNVFNGTFEIDNTGGNYAIQSTSGTLTLAGPVTIGLTVPSARQLYFQGAANGVIAVNMTGNIAPVFAGPGTWTVNSIQTYYGPTSVNGGTLSLNVNQPQYGTLYYGSNSGSITINNGGTLLANNYNALTGWGNNASAVVVNAGGTLANRPGFTNHIVNLTLAGGTLAGSPGSVNFGGFDVQVNSVINVTASSTISTIALTMEPGSSFNVAANATLSLTGSIANSAATAGVQLVKNGAGTMVVSGASTYTGTTSVNAGTLRVDGAVGTGAVSVASGATLSGVGSAPGAVTVASGGTLAPGDPTAIGTLSTGPLTLQQGATLAVPLGGGTGYDQVSVTGNVALGGATLALTGSRTPRRGEAVVVVKADNSAQSTGTFNGVAQGSTRTVGGIPYVVKYQSGNSGVGVGASFVLIDASPLMVSIGGNPGQANAGAEVSVTALSTNASAADVAGGFAYAWTVQKDGATYALPPGTTTNAATFNFTPLASGTYTVALQVTAVASGNAASATASLTVSTTPKLVPPQPQQVEAGVASTLSLGSVTGLKLPSGGSVGSFVAQVNWGDGSPQEYATVTVGLDAAGQASIASLRGTHSYASGGSYQLTVTASDPSLSWSQTAGAAVSVGLPQVYRVPGAAGETTRLRFTKGLTTAGYHNELDLFGVDAAGRIGTIAPGDASYANAALTSPSRQVIFDRFDLDGTVKEIDLPAGAYLSFFLIQNSDTATALAVNPTNVIDRDPTLLFPDASANPDGHFSHYRRTDPSPTHTRYGIEDLDYGGDRDYDDMVVDIEATVAPVLIAVADITVAQVKLTWTGDPGVQDGFAIERRDGSGAFQPLAMVGPGTFAYTDTTVLAGTEYTYRVRAVTGTVTSGWSNEFSASLRTAETPTIAGAPATSPEGSPITLTASSTSGNSAYLWVVTKDGQAYQGGNGSSFSFMPNDNGSYVVTLTGTTAGGSASTSKTIAVTNVDPSASINNVPPLALANQSVRLASTVTDPGSADTFGYHWRATLGGEEVATGDQSNFNFTPSSGGSYVVTLDVEDDDGGIGHAAAMVTVAGAPTVSILNAPTACFEGTTISLNSSVTGEGLGGGVGYRWTVSKGGQPYAGDTSGRDSVFSFTPDDNGTYEVRLSATAAGGTGDAPPVSVLVANVAPTARIIGSNPSEGSAIQLSAAASDAGPVDRASLAYAWVAYKHGIDAPFAKGTDPTFGFTPDDGSQYDVTLTVTDKDGAAATATAQFNVTPGAPNNVVAETISPTEVEVRWSDTSNIEQQFDVFAAKENGAPVYVGTALASRTDFEVTGLDPGTRYRFKVRAILPGSAPADSFEAQTYTTPNAVTGLTAIAQSNKSIALSWTAQAFGYDGFLVQQQAPSDLRWVTIIAAPKAQTAYTPTTLVPNTTYTYRVLAYAGYGGTVSLPSNVADATTLNVAPQAPTGITASASASVPGGIDLAWTNPAGNNQDRFDIDYSVDGLHYSPALYTTPTATGGGVYGLKPGTQYVFRVRAVNLSGASANSTTATAQTAAYLAPDQLSVIALDNTSVTLNWHGRTAVTSYYAVQATADQAVAPTVSQTFYPATTGGYRVTGLLPGVPYTFTVQAVYTTATTSNPSDGIPATTTTATPATPTGLAAAQGIWPGEVDLSWADNSDNERGFKVDVSTDGVAFQQVWPSSYHYYGDYSTATNTAQMQLFLRPAKQYWFRVRAGNEAGDSVPTTYGPFTVAAFPAPDGVVGTPTGSHAATVSFHSNTTRQSGFIVEAKADDEPDYTARATVYASGQVVGGLRAGVTYTFRIRAVGYFSLSLGNSPFTSDPGPESAAVLMPAETVPAAPTNLGATASPTDPHQIALRWTDNSDNEVGFQVETSLDGVTFGSPRNAAFSPDLATGLRRGTTYYFRVRAYNDAGNSAWSNTASDTTINVGTTTSTAPSDTAPAAPALSSVTPISPGEVKLIWQDNADNETAFRVEVSTDGSRFSRFATLPSPNIGQFNVTGLTPSTRYWFRVVALNGAGDSAASNVLDATTPAFASPSDLAAQPLSHTQILLAWADHTSNEKGFYVERSTDGDAYQSVASVPANMRSYLATGLTPNQDYYFRVRAYADDGPTTAIYTSAYSNVARSAALPLAIPDDPTGLVATVLSDHQVRLAWNDNSNDAGNNQEDRFEILLWKNEGDIPDLYTDPDVHAYTLSATPTVAGGYAAIPLQPGTAYEFRVRAVNAAGFSNPSNMVYVTMLPAAPVGLQAVADTATSVALSWPASTGAIYYTVQRSDDGQTWSQVGPDQITDLSYSDTGLTTNQICYYRLIAGRDEGNSVPSASVRVAVRTDAGFPATPKNVRAAATSSSVVRVNWDAVDSADGYHLQHSADGANWTDLAVPAGSTYADDTGRREGAVYYYRVSATNVAGESTFAAASTYTRLATPAGLAVSFASGHLATLTWGNRSALPAALTIRYTDDPTPTEASTWTTSPAIAAGSVSYALAGSFRPSTTYSFEIRATYGSLTSDFSAAVPVTTAAFPQAPDGLTATMTTAAATLSWHANSTDETGFLLERSVDGGASWEAVTTTAHQQTSWTDGALTEGTAYAWRVSSVNAHGASAYASFAASTRYLAPALPSGTSVSGREIDLRWTPVSTHAVGYNVFQTADAAGTTAGTLVASVYGTSARSVAVLGNFPPSTAVYLYVVATSNPGTSTGNSSARTPVLSVTTAAYPQAPSGLQTTKVTSDSVALVWNRNSTDENEFLIERNNDGYNWYAIGATDAGDTSFVDATAGEGTHYVYRVSAINAAGASAYAPTLAVDTKPAAPAALSVGAVSGHELTLYWTDRSSHEAGFKVYQVVQVGGIDQWVELSDSTARPGTHANTFSTSGPFTASTTYRFVVRAFSAGGESDDSNVATVTTPAWPDAPAVSGQATGPHHIDVTWLPVAGATGYRVYRRDALSTWKLVDSETTATAFADRTVTPDRFWRYGVAAYNAAGESGFSQVLQIAPPAIDTASPTDIGFAAVTSSSVHVSWADHAADEERFEVWRSLDGANFTLLGTAPANATGYDDIGLSPVTTYWYQVRAVRPDGPLDVPTNFTEEGYAITQFADDPGAMLLAAAASTPMFTAAAAPAGGGDPGPAPEAPPAGYPKGRPAPTDDPGEQGGKRLYHVTINGSSTLDFGTVTGSVTGSVTLKQTWIWSKSPEDAVKDAVASGALTLKRKDDPAGGVPVQFMQDGLFKLKPVEWQHGGGDGFYDTYITGQSILDGKWNAGCIHVRIDTPWAEADVDSANADGFAPQTDKNHDKLEDKFEDTHPGKIVQVDDGDLDEDSVPDFADFDLSTAANSKPPMAPHFVPITLTVPSAIDLSKAKLKVDYDGFSSPSSIERTGTGTADDPYVYKVKDGFLRVWTKDANKARNKDSVASGGDLIVSGDVLEGSKLTGLFGGKHQVVLWLEAVRPSTALGDQEIKVEVDPGSDSGGTFVSFDAVRTTNVVLDLAVDANRDGTISYQRDDATSAKNPYRFWLNNDHDDADYDTGGPADSADTQISNARDLEDFAPMKLGYSDLIRDGLADDISIGFTNTSGSPSVRLWSVGGDLSSLSKYQTDEQAANTILNSYGNSARFRRIDSESFVMPWDKYAGDFYSSAENSAIDSTPMIWEAIAAGTGRLTVSLLKNGIAFATTNISLDLADIKKFYEAWTLGTPGNSFGDTATAPNPRDIGPTYGPVTPYPTTVTTLSDSAPTTADDRAKDSKDYVLFVHGWRMTPGERRGFAETAYKRLYWQGFKGRLGLFSWPTEVTTTDLETVLGTPEGRLNFNNSEMKAYASAGALRSLINQLDADGYSVNLYAHSMGNIVASEALRQEAISPNAHAIVNTYVASQAASSAASYDPNVVLNPANLLHQSYSVAGISLSHLLSPTPDIYTAFPVPVNVNGGQKVGAYFEDIGLAATKMYNFYNPHDGAVGSPTLWPLNQALKGDDVNQAAAIYTGFFTGSQASPLSYSYQNGAWSEQYILLNPDGSLNTSWTRPLYISVPYDAYAIMAYAAESKSKGLGATANVGFGFTMAGQVDVSNDFGAAARFTNSRADHSGQFNLDLIHRNEYWNVLMKRFGLKVNKDTTSALGGRK